MKENNTPRYSACNSLDDIARAKSELKDKITAQKERIEYLSNNIFPPVDTLSTGFSLFKNLKSGIAIINGVLLGLKIMRKFRQFFQRNK